MFVSYRRSLPYDSDMPSCNRYLASVPSCESFQLSRDASDQTHWQIVRGNDWPARVVPFPEPSVSER